MVQTHKVAEQREFANVLYYGDGGTGKTTALATMANLGGRVLYIDAESGIKRRPLEARGIKVENIELPDLPSPLEYKALEDVFWQMKADLDADPDSWTGCVWDSGTEIARALIEGVVATRVAKAERLSSTTEAAQLMKDPFFIDRDNWGYMAQQFRQLIRRFRDLDCHFGMSFLERRDVDKEKGATIGPAINPALQNDVVGWHDIVIRTSVDNGVRLGVTAPEGIRIGKDRYGALPFRMVNPTFQRILGYIDGELLEETDPVQRVDEEEQGSAPKPAAAKATTAKTTAKKKASKPKPTAVKDETPKDEAAITEPPSDASAPLTPLERAKRAAAARKSA